MSACNQTCDGDACAAAITLGVLDGILLILLGVVTTGLMWTCRKLKKVKKSEKTDSRQIDIDGKEDVGGVTQQSNNPAYGVGSTQPSHDQITSPDQEHGYETVTYTRPVTDKSTTNQAEILYKNEHEYDRLDRGQNGHKATSKSLEQCKQNKTSSKRNQESKELESGYSRPELKKSDGKKDSEEHIYHVLEGPSN